MIKLIVDSTFGLSEKYVKQNDIQVVNLKMILDDKVYDEGFEDSWGEFYEHMEKSKNFPTTSQPSPQDFIDAINRVYEKDQDAEILILTISSGLSGTINSATIASNSFEGKRIVAHDTRNATTCCRMLVEEVIEKINQGISFDDLLQLLPTIEDALKIQFIPASMDALKRSGRVGSLGALMASLLKIKPLFKYAKGKVTVVKKCLGFAKAVAEAVSNIPSNLKKIYVCYIHNKINLPLLVSKIKSALKIEHLEEVSLEPVFGVHVGIGAVGVATLENYQA